MQHTNITTAEAGKLLGVTPDAIVKKVKDHPGYVYLEGRRHQIRGEHDGRYWRIHIELDEPLEATVAQPDGTTNLPATTDAPGPPDVRQMFMVLVQQNRELMQKVQTQADKIEHQAATIARLEEKLDGQTRELAATRRELSISDKRIARLYKDRYPEG